MQERHRQEVGCFIKKVVDIPSESLEQFYTYATSRNLAKGEDFIREGEICNEIMFIHRGSFRYYLLTAEKEHTKDFSPEKTFCTAYTSLVTHTPSRLYIAALEAAEVSVWQGDYLLSLADKDLFWQTFVRRMADYLYIRKEKREISFLLDDAIKRYQHFLSEFPTLAQFHEVSEKVPQHYIASYLGMTPETLSRVKRSLKEVKKSLM
jgi:CRP-like cAMP-binding protein